MPVTTEIAWETAPGHDAARDWSIERLFLALIGVLLGVGILMVYSSSVTSRPTEFEQVYLTRHLGAAALGLLAAALLSQLSVRHWQVLLPWMYLAVICLLIAALVPGVGTSVKGARRWLRIAGISVQPSELAKLVLPMWTCLRITQLRREWDGRSFWHLVWPTGLLVPLVFLEPDLGTSLFLLLGTAVALYLGGWPHRWFWYAGAGLLPACLGLWWLKPYQWQRIVGFIQTWQDFDSAPYQIRQSLLTLGSGGWCGTGLGQGWQKLSFLPEANTDFVFAVIGEELGLSGTLGLITIWCGVYLCGIRLLSRHHPASFEFLAGTTLLSQLVIQAMINVAVVTAMVPPKGIAHPLISAGGSNLVVSLMILGTIWGLSRERLCVARPETSSELLGGESKATELVQLPISSGLIQTDSEKHEKSEDLSL